MIEDPLVVEELERQLAVLQSIEWLLAARAAHPPAVSTREWHGVAADAHGRAQADVRRGLRFAHEAVLDARDATRAELLRARA